MKVFNRDLELAALLCICTPICCNCSRGSIEDFGKTFTCLFGVITKKGLFLTMERISSLCSDFFGVESSCAIMPTTHTDNLCINSNTSTGFSSGLSLVVSVKLL